MERPRYLEIVKELAFNYGKMAFLAGPRQVGKTTLAQQIGSSFKQALYYNWDDIEFKKKWLKTPSLLLPQNIGEKALVIFDELHKAPKWKTTLKGLYDTKKEYCSILVTGSARLDIYRRGGDSMLGRYFLFRLHPFSIGEVENTTYLSPDNIASRLITHKLSTSTCYSKLFEFGGFPDPFLNANTKFHNLWRQGRIERLVREDLIDLSRLRETSLMQTLMAMLPEKVGSPLSVQSLTEDLDSNHPTIKRWLSWLEQIYYTYHIPPYSKKLARSLKKQPKLYLWDWSEVTEEPARFENMVAGHLLKGVHFWNDTGEGFFELFYLRNKQKEEVDFLIVRDKKPWMMVECKLNETKPSSALIYFSKILKPDVAIQVVHVSRIHSRFDLDGSIPGVVVSADSFLGLFP